MLALNRGGGDGYVMFLKDLGWDAHPLFLGYMKISSDRLTNVAKCGILGLPLGHTTRKVGTLGDIATVFEIVC